MQKCRSNAPALFALIWKSRKKLQEKKRIKVDLRFGIWYLLGKEIPDLILLDYEMPVCDGVQTLKLIRSEKRFKDIPVFFLTGVDDTEKVKLAVELKPEGYILKSTPQNQIIEKIKSFFTNQ